MNPVERSRLTLLLLVMPLAAFGQGSLPTPILYYPPPNGFNDTASSFAWGSAAGASSYQLQVSRDSTAFLDIAVDTTTADTVLGMDIFEPDGWYHWRVRALNMTDSSSWSEARRFYLKFPVGVELRPELPKHIRLVTHYPNPFRSIMHTFFSLDRAAEVRIDVFDLIGRTVGEEELGWQGSGEHVAHWSGIHQPPGAYLFRITVGPERIEFLTTKVP